MKIFFPLILLFSLLLIQIHGSSHVEHDQSDSDHHCTVCEIVSHQPSLTPTTIVFNFSSELAFIKVFQIIENDFIPNSFILKSIGPRAPPIVS